jgi:hypothetical protein
VHFTKYEVNKVMQQLIQRMNNELLIEQAAIQSWISVITENCNQLQILGTNIDTLVESAEEFLGQLSVNLSNGKLPKEQNDIKLRDSMTMLTVLDLLRNPQSRKELNVNTIKGYLSIVDGVSRNLDKNGIEIQVMKELDRMTSVDGKNGMDVRDEYIKQAVADDLTPLIQQVKKLGSQYQQIQAKLKTATTATQPAPQAAVGQNVRPATA